VAVVIVMFDTITVKDIPSFANTSADAVAGYMDGRYADLAAMEAAFPKAHHLSITVTAGELADCLDVETGDATPSQAAAWVKKVEAVGIWRPCLYANRSTMPAVETNLKDNGVGRGQVRLWVADFTGTVHLPAGFDACQWTDRALGRNLDESICLGTFFQGAAPDDILEARVMLRVPHGAVEGVPLPWTIVPLPRGEDGSLEAKVTLHAPKGSLEGVPLPWAISGLPRGHV
jgi:hypothetical protein